MNDKTGQSDYLIRFNTTHPMLKMARYFFAKYGPKKGPSKVLKYWAISKFLFQNATDKPVFSLI